MAVWKRLGKMFPWKGADIWVSDLFYRAVIQAVLLFESESWAMLDAMVQGIDGSHVGFLRKIAMSG